MIYEYAIDPDLVKSWVLSRDVGLAPQFGMDQRRLVSDIASGWEGEVYSSLWQHFDCDDRSPEFIDAHQFMTALMELLHQGSNRGFKRTTQPWIEQVLKAHREEPFHAILSGAPVSGCNEVITPEVTRDLRNTRWYVPTIDATSKTAESVAVKLTTFLRLANKIYLIDPYFDPSDETYCKALKSLVIKAVSSRGPDRSWPEFTIMSGVNHRQTGRESRANAQDQQWFTESRNRCESAKRELTRVVPEGLTITFQCIAALADGDEVHNRYLLTDIGGVLLPYGSRPTGEDVFDDITPLFAGQYRKRWSQYCGRQNRLHVIGSPVQIDGQLKS